MEKCYGVIMSYLSDLISTVDGLSVYLDCDLRQLKSWVCLSYLPRASRCHEDADSALRVAPLGAPCFWLAPQHRGGDLERENGEGHRGCCFDCDCARGRQGFQGDIRGEGE